MDKNHTCCFTGHRFLSKLEKQMLVGRLDKVIGAAASGGVTLFLAGGALGFDTLAALRVLHLKQTRPDIQLHLVLPYKGQSRSWKGVDQTQYEEILWQADGFEFVADAYRSGCYYARNRRMVDRSGLCISYQLRQDGGTAYTVRLAKQQGLPVWNISEYKFYVPE